MRYFFDCRNRYLTGIQFGEKILKTNPEKKPNIKDKHIQTKLLGDVKIDLLDARLIPQKIKQYDGVGENPQVVPSLVAAPVTPDMIQTHTAVGADQAPQHQGSASMPNYSLQSKKSTLKQLESHMSTSQLHNEPADSIVFRPFKTKRGQADMGGAIGDANHAVLEHLRREIPLRWTVLKRPLAVNQQAAGPEPRSHGWKVNH